MANKAKIKSLSAFMKVDAKKRWNHRAAPLTSFEEMAHAALAKLVRNINLKHKPLTTFEFLDLAHHIGELVGSPDGITARLAQELVEILASEWARDRTKRRQRYSDGRKPSRG